MSGYRHKSFDPSSVVENAQRAPKKPKYEADHTFADFGFEQPLYQNILDHGFERPTPIQDQIMPAIMEQRDVIGAANTGTGKTAAFLIPLINNLLQDESRRILIMTPTRELAQQIDAEFKLFAKGLKRYSTVCIGGTSIRKQIQEIKRKPHMVIGTPGRLIDLTKQNKLPLQHFSGVVLDEADRMLDMGFINDMEFMLQQLPDKRQTLFFSATMPESLDRVVKRFVHNPERVSVSTSATARNVDQEVVRVNGRSKLQLLHDLLVQDHFEKVLVFGRTKRGLNKLSNKLQKKGHRIETIHGNKSQNQRRRALKKFKDNHVNILLATDVASRGLDIDDITHVINYDLPESYEVYIHRIGRTGRANKTGTALSFV